MQLQDNSYDATVGTSFRLVQPSDDMKAQGLKKGAILTLTDNDGSNCPEFRTASGAIIDCFWWRLETLDDSPNTQPTPTATRYEDRAYPNIQAGRLFVIVDAVGMEKFRQGDVVKLKINDGSSFPFFQKCDATGRVVVDKGIAIKWRRLEDYTPPARRATPSAAPARTTTGKVLKGDKPAPTTNGQAEKALADIYNVLKGYFGDK